jgi:2-polyprenyl-3-methyl-5-hydroxy-6-metoxy-1,4-benzoquinol methylase
MMGRVYETSTTMARGGCGLCGSKRLIKLPVPRQTVGGPLAKLPGVGLKRCVECGFELVEPRPSDGALAAFYAGQDYTAHEPVDDAAARRRAAGQLAVIEAAGGRIDGGAVLDVGCGGGQLLAAARVRGAKVCGVDVAAHAHEACRRQGLPVVATLDELGAARFDGIVMSHVLEHVPDVLATLAELHERLRTEGWLCLEVPNRASLRARLSPEVVTKLGADERHRAFPIHHSYFTPQTLGRALAATGFAVVTMTTSGLGVDALWPRWAPRPGRPEASAGATAERSPARASVDAEQPPGRASVAAGDKARAQPASPAAASPLTASGVLRRLRAAAKRRYFDALLGENLIVVARPAS